MRRARGFTLLEVLVALAILSLVMLVLGQTLGSAIRAYSHLDLKTRAWEVASDKMVELQVYARWPAVGTQKTRLKRDGNDWQVTTKVTKGPFPGTRQVAIAVTLEKDADKGGALYTLTGLIGAPHDNNAGTKPAANGSGGGASNNANNGSQSSANNGVNP